MCEKKKRNFHFYFIFSQLDISLLPHIFDLLVIRVLLYVSNEFGISTAFRFRENLRHGTDRLDATLYGAPRDDCEKVYLLLTQTKS